MKKALILSFMICVSLPLVIFSCYFKWPLYEWMRIFLIFPVVYAGVNFRRAGAFFAMMFVLMIQTPMLGMQYLREPSLGINYLVSVVAVLFAGMYLGHLLRKEKENTASINQTREILESIQRDVVPDSLLSSLEKRFREWGKSDIVEIYLFDADGKLVKRGDAGGDTLPEDHVFHEIAEGDEIFTSDYPSTDFRIRYYGPDDKSELISRMAVFPMEYGGRRRGVIALANPADEQFGRETVTFLNTIKQAHESALELVEKRSTTIEHELRREKIRGTFSSYVSKSVADEILKNPDRVDLGGKLQEVSIIFSEVSNFSELSAEIEPAELISMLNEYFSAAIDTVFEHDGTLDKFIGNNVMAFWGAPLPAPNCEEKAVRCALAFLKRISALNVSWARQGKPAFKVCMGINSGAAVAGNIGGMRRMEYTVIGDTVNMASRIKNLSSENNIPVLISETTFEKVEHLFRFGDGITAAVKGKSDNITVYRLIGIRVYGKKSKKL